MDDNEATTSDETLRNTKITYGKATTRLLRRIALQVTSEVDLRRPPIDNSPMRVFRYTGFNEKSIRILNILKRKNIVVKHIDRREIQKALIQFYSNFEYIPTTTELYSALTPVLPLYVNIDYFRKILVQMGYCWQRVRAHQKQISVIVEHPKIRFERFMYLRNIIQRRNCGPMYFIGIASLTMLTSDFKKSTERVNFAYTINNEKVDCFKLFPEINETLIEEWLLENVIPNLPKKSVVIFDDSEFVSKQICKIPDLDSLKVEMTEWLDFHSVPYDDSMPKSALYALVEKYTDVHENVYAFDILLKNYGHEVLRIPSCIRQVSPVYWVNRVVCTQHGEVSEILDSIIPEIITKFNIRVAKEEKKIFWVDEIVEANWAMYLTNTMTRAVDVEDIDDYLPEWSDSE